MTIRSMFVAVVSMFTLACGAPEDGGGSHDGGNENVTCSATGTLTDALSNGRTVVTANGTITCTGQTQIDVQTCLQWNVNGSTFEDVQCNSLSGTSTTLSATSAVSCIGTKVFRTRVTGTSEFVSEARSISCQ